MILAFVVFPARAQPIHYTVTVIEPPTGDTTVAAALNNAGQATGDAMLFNVPLSFEAFRFDPGNGAFRLNDGPFLPAHGRAINDQGQVAGEICINGGPSCQWPVFRYTDAVGLEILGVLGNGTGASVDGINQTGDVVGTSTFSPGVQEHAFLYTDENGMIDLGTLSKDNVPSYGRDLNDARQVVGDSVLNAVHAFLWQDGAMQDLGTLGGASSAAAGINHAGQIVGFAGVPGGGDHAFRFTPGVGLEDFHPPFASLSRGTLINDAGTIAGTFTFESSHLRTFVFGDATGFLDVGVLDPDALHTHVEPVDINAAGHVVGVERGFDQQAGGLVIRPFVWTPELGLVDLNAVTATDHPGLALDDTVAINDVGQILANGTVDGARRAIILTPVPAGPSAPTILVLDQLRSTSTLVAFAACGITASDSEQAPDVGPFDSSLFTDLKCGADYAAVLASQQSQINETSLIASGTSFVKAPVAGHGAAALGDSRYLVVFDLSAPALYTADGLISTGGVEPSDAIALDAQVTLTGPGNRIVFDHSISSSGAPVSQNVSESGLLLPGGYTFLASASLALDAAMPLFAVGEADFDVTFAVAPLPTGSADLDGDGDVDLHDFAMFVACVGGPGAPPQPACIAAGVDADFDHDRDVDFADFAIFQRAFTGE